ncbi:MAG: acetylornithine deacetylase [Candidatus Puniceispirillales bacterium]
MAKPATTVEFLCDLVAFPTVSRDPNRALIAYCADILAEAGAQISIIEADEGRKANLYATIGPDDQPGVMLSGHSDVVPVDGQNWTLPPFEATLKDGRVYGRGTADMKGFLAACLTCARAAGERVLKTPLHLAFSHDEEIGCVGVHSLLDMLAEAPVRPAMCIVGEPTSMAIATGHKGKTALEATCIGSEAHSALAPQAVNAIHLACDLVAEIRKMQDHLAVHGARDDAYAIPYTTLHAGVINGGTVLNIVPGQAAVTFEIRNLAADNPDQIIADLRQAIAPIITAARQRAPEADIILSITNAYPGLETPLDDDVVAMVAELTGRNDRIKVAFGTEGGLFSSRLGVPTVVCGPGSMDQGHKPDEFIALDQLDACDAMLGSLLNRLEAGL